MHGHGEPPPARNAGTVITLRVLMAACSVLSCGVFACVPLFRVAFLRGRWYDWLASWVSLVVSVGCFVTIGELPENDPRSDIAVIAILLVALGAAVHFLVADIRFHNNAAAHPGYAPPHGRTMPAAYGYPQPAAPYQDTPAPMPVPPRPEHPAPQTYTPAQPPVHPPAPARPAPARIDQVRAELDELSDYLRRQDGKPEGGR
ncbi:hypothetical protein [Streptomyces sp. NPDC046860]|uniref:hypothetical protein n=1 Tax=Streptomyces sp. NPDC046860 TaxID=3154495 RepID=UPI0033E779EF